MTKASDLIGGYTVTSGEKYGEPIPSDRVAGTTARFTENSIVVTDKEKREVYANTYELDSSVSPCRITMTSKLGPNEGEVAHGLVEKTGETVRLIYALPGSDAPTEFKTKDRQLMFVMENLNK